MKYSLSIALKRLKKNKITNLLIFIQMAVGVILLTIFLNISFVIHREYQNYISSNENRRFRLYANKLELTNENAVPIVPQQEEFLKRKMGKQYESHVIYDFITFAGRSHIDDKGESITDRYVVDYSSETEEILVEEEFLRTLNALTPENTVHFEDVCFSAMDGFIVFQKGERIPYKIQEWNAEEYCHQIKIPIKYYFLYQSSNSFSDCYVELKFDDQSTDSINRMLFDIESKLEESNKFYDYTVSSEFFDFLYKSSFDSDQASFFSFLSMLLITIVYIGMLSLFIMLVEKRKFELAVCLALGAGKKQVFSELSLEFLILSITPSFVGFIISNVIISKGFRFINVFISSYSIMVEMLIFFSIVVLNFLCLLQVFYKIRKLKPQEILYKNK